MRRLVGGILWISTLMAFSAFAQEGPLDRSQDVARFIQTIETSTRGKLTEAAKEIADADLSDTKLAAAIHDKLAADLPQLSSKSAVDKKYRSTMIAALVSTGIDAYLPFIENTCAALGNENSSKECTAVQNAIRWHRVRNQLANTKRTDFHDDELHLARIANLLMADDFAFKEEAAHRMNWKKILDTRLLDIIEAQLMAAMQPRVPLLASLRAAPRDQPQKNYPRTTTLATYVKLLGYSGNTKYRAIMDQILNSNPARNIQIEARAGARRLAM